jgi:predicted DNA-binding transcriptional regulator AlpA
MEAEAKSRILPGDSLIKPADCARQRFGRSARWLWGKLKSPGFPKPVYIDGSPSFISREIDEYLARCASGEKAAA